MPTSSITRCMSLSFRLHMASNSLANGGLKRIRVKDPKESGKFAYFIASYIISRRSVSKMNAYFHFSQVLRVPWNERSPQARIP